MNEKNELDVAFRPQKEIDRITELMTIIKAQGPCGSWISDGSYYPANSCRGCGHSGSCGPYGCPVMWELEKLGVLDMNDAWNLIEKEA